MNGIVFLIFLNVVDKKKGKGVKFACVSVCYFVLLISKRMRKKKEQQLKFTRKQQQLKQCLFSFNLE